uniref:Methionine--tRNA ligase, cytoplasmic n=1 Tax=Amphimedon queenslandica TaxID=400682 RepID=A0A1X7UZY2_AMPQE
MDRESKDILLKGPVAAAWNDASYVVKCFRAKPSEPILPVSGERNVLVTSALPYVNNVPHLGNLIGCVLSGDVFARYCRQRNYNVLYVCGTDEYGTATETKAIEEGLTPKEICDKYFEIHDKVYKWFNIDFDIFGRTSTAHQTRIAQEIFWDLYHNGFIVKDNVDQLLCQTCDRFLADRFVEGICPFCSFDGARGDQCDKCGHLINAIELKSPKCKLCSSEPCIKTSNHLFLDLAKLQDPVNELFMKSSDQGVWSNNAKIITSTWLRDGLNRRCISRDLKWGTPVPLDGYTNKVFYVWFDAPIGYISITAGYIDEWEKWWKNPDEVKLYQFMAKDNVPFHTVVFPASLIGTKKPYTFLDSISSTEFLNYEDGKFSKSRGVGVFGNDAIDTGIPADVFRFYLLLVRPETQDSVFSWSDFAIKVNAELVNNLGNFINRTLTFLGKNYELVMPPVFPNDGDIHFLEQINVELQNYIENMEKCKLRDGLKCILSISKLGNGYLQAGEPWKLLKLNNNADKLRADSIIGISTNVVYLLCILLYPFMPSAGSDILKQLNVMENCIAIPEAMAPFLAVGHKINEPFPLFVKLEDSQVLGLKKKYSGK